MKKKLWSISTTVRNPYRIIKFLTVLNHFNGFQWNKLTQRNFQISLIKNRLYGYSEENGFNQQFLNGLTNKQIEIFTDFNHILTFNEAEEIFNKKNYEDPPMRGRTSYKPLEKLGLVIIKNKKIEITKLGKYVLSKDFNLSEFFFKSFLKWQYPNPLSTKDFVDKNIYNIKPFIGILHLISEVNNLCKKKNIIVKGISKQEFEIFGLSLIHYKDIKKFAKLLIDFRLNLCNKKENQRKLYINQYIKSFLSDYINITNAKDYSDNAIRYFRLTNYIYIRGGGYYIDLEPRRKIEIDNLLKTDNASALKYSKEDYIKFITDINQPILPWETESKLIQIYKRIIVEINQYERKLNEKKSKYSIPRKKNELLEKINSERKYRKELQDRVIKFKFDNIKEIEKVISNLTNIRKLPIKSSIALEKLSTDALNIINDALLIKPNYPVGDDNEPTFTAPANIPDIECYYKSFNSICEVTMLTSRNQWFNEGQPVMRHLREFEEKNNKDSYCIFIAPKLHIDTINTFWMSVKYEYQGKAQKIIPITISQLIEILQTIIELKQINKNITHYHFKKLLDAIINSKYNKNHSKEWVQSIQNEIYLWKKEITL